MSGKIIRCIRFTLSRRISPQYLHTVYLDSSLNFHAGFYGNDFLNECQVETVRRLVRDVLIENKKSNSLLSCTCLLYELKQRKGVSGCLYMDYLVAFSISSKDFLSNENDLLPQREIFYEKEFIDGLELVSDKDSDLSSDED